MRKPAGGVRRARAKKVAGWGLQIGLTGHCIADRDKIVADDAEADPAAHAVVALVAAAVEAVAPLDYADAAL